MEAITFDALTVAMVNDALATRGIGVAQLAWAISEAVGTARQYRRLGIDVKVKSHGGRRDAATSIAVRHMLNVELSGTGGRASLRLAGYLVERRDGNAFEVGELGVGKSARFVATHNDVLRLQVSQQLPETIRMGLNGMAGQPLSRLVGHVALERPEAAGILILSIEEPRAATRSRIGMAQGLPEHGFDVRVDAPRIAVRPFRR